MNQKKARKLRKLAVELVNEMERQHGTLTPQARIALRRSVYSELKRQRKG